VAVGGVLLWPLTLAASEWYRSVGCNLSGHEHNALAYAMAHCYAAGDPFALAEPGQTVSAWVRTIKATTGSVRAAMESVVLQMENMDMPPNKDGRTVSVGEVSAMLAAMTSIPPDFWESRCCINYAVAMLHVAMQQANQTGKPLASDPTIKAEIALGWAVLKVRRRHEGNVE
jgi:hypothetical protein